MIQHGGLIDGAGVVVQAPGDSQIYPEVLLRHPEGPQILGHGTELRIALVKHLVAAHIALQGLQYLLVAAVNGDKPENLVGGLFRNRYILHQNGFHLIRADFVQLIHRAHDLAGLVLKSQHGIEAIEDLPVVHPDLEPLQPQP